MKKIYVYYTISDLLKFVLEIIFALALGVAFYHYKLYAPIAFLAAIAGYMIYDQVRFILIDETGLSDFHRLGVAETIGFENVTEVDTSITNGRHMVSVYGEGKAITFPFRKKSYRALLLKLGLSDGETDRLVLGEILSGVFGDWKISVSAVSLDELMGKRQFIKREIVKNGK